MEILSEILENDIFKKHKKIKKFSLKVYDKSDFESLMMLYEKVFPGYMSEDLWIWKNITNPNGNFYTILMKDKDKVISAYSVAPKKFSINCIIFPCVLSMDTMTDEDYRGRGISTYLARLTYEYAKRKGAYFVYGFPNKISRHLIFNKVNWVFFGKRDFIRKNISKGVKLANSMEIYSIKEIGKFDKDYNNFWEEFKKNYPIIINKDSIYLNWRFVNHPLTKYKKFLIYEENEIIGYFILKRFKDKEGHTLGHIVDFLIGPQNNAQKTRIFKTIEGYSLREFQHDCQRISFWMPDDNLKGIAINDLGYVAVQKKKYFGYKILRKHDKFTILESPQNWQITMSNSDVF